MTSIIDTDPTPLGDDRPVVAGDAPAPARGPRIRWGGIVWGVFFAATAGAGLWIVGSVDHRGDVAAWFDRLTIATAVGTGILALGIVLLVAGLVGLLRRAQKTLAARDSAAD